ncbi:hypothetical protein GMOD_00000225 [Pyrenophora seminiperda CCB06]|uniref:Uncharacterized protein n=1 Tax=Pyrenophora seminiperda CCB06 TaxID=1302712 RepID=A0A3M7M6R4_9PLEO|nr:hypothetical protein GMOD_00000225 [Pyrenophora seminiperda CCB06]
MWFAIKTIPPPNSSISSTSPTTAHQYSQPHSTFGRDATEDGVELPSCAISSSSWSSHNLYIFPLHRSTADTTAPHRNSIAHKRVVFA